MLRKAFGAFVVALIAMVPSFAKADFHAGAWELTLGGTGTSNRGLTQGSFNVSGSLGYFFNKNLEVSVRQNVGYSDFNAGTVTTAATRGAVDWHFDFGNWQPFIGGNVGYTYGSRGVQDNWEVAPEAGVKYFLNSTTFAFGMAEYQVFFRGAHGGNFDRGQLIYTIGLGVVLK